jgi:hypothetical protein
MAIMILSNAAAGAQNAAPAPADAQNAAPAAAGSDVASGLPVSGTLHYDLRYFQTAQFGSYLDGQQQSFVSGDASYANLTKRLPFSLQYGGGYGWVWAGPPSPGNLFQSLSLSQGFVGRVWKLNASDSFSYIYETPTTGFAGVPGSGEPIGGSGTSTPPVQTILTVNTSTLSNMTTGSAERQLDRANTISIDGTYGELRYFDAGFGQDMNTLVTDATITHNLSKNNSVLATYTFSRFSFLGVSPNLASQAQISYGQSTSLQIGFRRQWNSKISTYASIGPQWISSSNNALLPSSTNYVASATVSDHFKIGIANFSYNHGFMGGAGYYQGAESDTLEADFSRNFGRKLTVGVTGSFFRTSSMNASGAVDATFGTAQATRKMGRYFSVFANYTYMNQSSNFANAALNVLNSETQLIGFGISYSPRDIRFKK